MMPFVATMILPTVRYPAVYTSAGRKRYVRAEASMGCYLRRDSFEHGRRDVSFSWIRPGWALDAAGGTPRFGVEKHAQPGDGPFVIFAFPTNIADPGRKVRNHDEFIPQPGEVGDVTHMHDARRAFIAGQRRGSLCRTCLVHVILTFHLTANDSSVWLMIFHSAGGQ